MDFIAGWISNLHQSSIQSSLNLNDNESHIRNQYLHTLDLQFSRILELLSYASQFLTLVQTYFVPLFKAPIFPFTIYITLHHISCRIYNPML